MIRALAALVSLCLLSQGCTTEVVDFPWECTTVMIKAGNRCTTCTNPKSGEDKTECEILECKTKAFGDSGTSGCKYCWWTKHPEDTCEICWGSTTTNTCSKDAGL